MFYNSTNVLLGKAAIENAPKPIEILVSKDVCSLAFIANGMRIVSGGFGGKVRVWHKGDGQEVGAALNAGSTTVLNIAVSRDGKWVVVGTVHGRVIVWDAECREKVAEFQGHENWVRAVDVSPRDTTKIASGSDDKTVCVWCIASAEQPVLQVGPLEHDYILAGVKFSPDGDLLATATWWKESVRIYNSWDGSFLFDIPIGVNSYENLSLSWLPNGTLLFALSASGDVQCFDVSSLGGTLHSHWSVQTQVGPPKCMLVANNGKFLAIAANSSVLFWDTATYQQIGPVIGHPTAIRSIAISPNYEFAIGGGKIVTVWSLTDILPSRYVHDDTPDLIDPTSFFEGNMELVSSPVNSDESSSNTVSTLHDECLENDLTKHVKRDSRDPVASGGFADIYRGMLQVSWEPVPVAIKAIRTYSGDNGSFFKKQRRLRREIKVWLNLNHINVLPLYGTTTGFGRFPAMVCPWIDNGCLTTYLEGRHAALSVVQILTLLNDAASGLQYLHSNSVVHGDLSGSNVLVCKDGRAYISDFGLSTLLTELGGSTFATSVHERGTLRWTAPELLDLDISEDESESKVAPTKHSDVYSFGGVMLQVLTGKIPYYYWTREVQVVHAVSRGIKPRRPNGALVTEHRWAFMQLCWSTADPSQSRPSSAEIVRFTNGELTGAIPS